MSALADEYYRLKYDNPEDRQKAFCCPESLGGMISGLSNKDIMKTEGLDQFSRLYLVCLKYGRNILPEAVLKQSKLAFKGAALNFSNAHFVKITSLESQDSSVLVRGFIFSSVLGLKFDLFARDREGNSFTPETEEYHRKDFSGLWGEQVSAGHLFKFSLPPAEYRFYVTIHGGVADGEEVMLNPSFEESTGMTRSIDNSCADLGDHVAVYSDGWLIINTASGLGDAGGMVKGISYEQALAEFRKTLNSQDDESVKPEIRRKWQNDLKIREMIKHAQLQNRVCFITTRTDNSLQGNLKYVYNQVKSDKIVYAKTHPKQDLEASLKVAEDVYSSKVIVTDDYLFIFRNYGKAAGQKVMQLWHAAGSFKKFGQDGSSFFPDVDAKYHKDYDCVTVSSEKVRPEYAHAFNVDIDKVAATGIARTDEFFDEGIRSRVTARIYEKYPALNGKKILLYAPTFRTLQGRDRSIFVPDLDFDELSGALGSGQVMVICPHPVMTKPILGREYDNIIEVRDFSTSDMMYAADLLITDYSSVIFDFSLLNKPILFYCYDFDEYDRDFYLDYDHDLPGDVVKSKSELLRIIKNGEYKVDGRMERFREHHMGACDGHSSERIAGIIDKWVKTE